MNDWDSSSNRCAVTSARRREQVEGGPERASPVRG